MPRGRPPKRKRNITGLRNQQPKKSTNSNRNPSAEESNSQEEICSPSNEVAGDSEQSNTREDDDRECLEDQLAAEKMTKRTADNVDSPSDADWVPPSKQRKLAQKHGVFHILHLGSTRYQHLIQGGQPPT